MSELWVGCCSPPPYSRLPPGGSMTYWCGSGSGPCLWQMDPDPDPAVVYVDLCLISPCLWPSGGRGSRWGGRNCAPSHVLAPRGSRATSRRRKRGTQPVYVPIFLSVPFPFPLNLLLFPRRLIIQLRRFVEQFIFIVLVWFSRPKNHCHANISQGRGDR